MRTVVAVFAAGVILASAPLARAQKPVTQSASAELTATIEAIDHDHRVVTLKDAEGKIADVYAGPDIKRFSELKVGDKVTFRYQESLVYKIRKPGDPAAPVKDQGPTVTRGNGPRPGGTIAQQQTATVTIKAIDAKVPAVTITTEDGRTSSFKVEDKSAMNGLKVGDKVEITYTEAVLISVK
jgi:Cu/Ag efflux protein CusF